MPGSSQGWFDEDAGPVVRPYALTRGRTRATTYSLSLITLVVARQPLPPSARALSPNYQWVLEACAYPVSVAEVAARADLPLGVVKILISDLIEREYVMFGPDSSATEGPNLDMMQKVLDGIRKL
ncbi:DUF742 domain-containing protein [Saccharopolyspora sp. K220]|uniref:DUF742 domain-containing protein n=1 Tax=Saccharopolyspora soli TaxID=2926618 RepID=UPI001F578A93|nr:DUF742 domain-containing protein [Saccharopolyspora soli]MCI2419452.1 DUF742 domain-containing protein [Saccharopolyspora soli]